MNKNSEIVARSKAKTTRRMELGLSFTTNGDVIAKLDSLGTGRTAYICQAIREKMQRDGEYEQFAPYKTK